MKKTIFLMILVFISSCSKESSFIEDKDDNSGSIEQKTISQKHDENLGGACACSSCMGIYINQKDEFIL